MALVIYGATGYTGSLIVDEARRQNIRPILAGRRREALEAQAKQWSPALETRLAAPDDPASLAAMLEDAEVLITTVGPFTDYGMPVAAAAVERGIHYLDTTGEQTFMVDCRALFHYRMQAQNRVMINAAAFEYTPGTIAAARFLRTIGSTDTLNITYSMGLGTGASRGTLKSILRLAGAEGITFREHEYAALRPLDATRQIKLSGDDDMQTSILFPGGEALTVPRFADVANVQTWLIVPSILPRLGPLSRAMAQTAREGVVYSALSTLINRLPAGPTAKTRSQSGGQVVLEAGEQRTDIFCPDPYGLTAQIAVDLAQRLLRNEHRASGVISAAEAFDSDQLWQQLVAFGVTSQSHQ